MMIYDDRFVADNVLIGQSVAVEQRRNIYGLVIGSQGITMKRRVDQAEQDLSNATSALSAADAQLKALLPFGWTIENLRPLAKEETIDKLISEASDELSAAKRTKQNADAIRARRALQAADPPPIPDGLQTILDTTLDDIALQAESEIKKHLAEHTNDLGLDWIRSGNDKQRATTCPYCGQEMEGLDILKSYRAFFSGALQELVQAQERILTTMEENFGALAQQRLEQLINAHTVESDWWRDAGDAPFNLPRRPSIEDIRAAMEAVKLAIGAAIQRKQIHPSVRVLLSEDEPATLATWAEVSDGLREYMSALGSINVAIADRQRTAGLVDIGTIEQRLDQLKAQKRRHEPEVVAALDVYDRANASKANKAAEKVSANTALREQSEQTLRDYGDDINRLLTRFGVDFRIVSTGVDFHGGPPAGGLGIELLGTRISTSPEDARNPALPSLANTLSGGDRSALGLAFFLAVVKRDAGIGNALVVFDDPFHSQDRSRRRRTIECIQQVTSDCGQCFVLSHDLDFAREASRIAGGNVRTFKVDGMADSCLLQAGDLPPLAGLAYEQDYSKLTGFLANPQIFAGRLKDVARCIRQTLEGYLRTKFPQSWEENDWIGTMIGKIRNAPSSASPNSLYSVVHLVKDLTEVNEWGKRYYHSESDGSDAGDVDSRELKTYVEQTLGIISR